MRTHRFAGLLDRRCFVAVAAILAACASHDPRDVGSIIPETSILFEPANWLRDRGYEIVYVETNIGTFEALRWRERRTSPRSGTTVGRADYLIVDVYADVPTGRTVMSVVAQTVAVSHSVRDLRPYDIRAADRPSGTVREDAEALLHTSGCELVQSRERRTGVYGPSVEVSCGDTPGA
jgi:hypothetical protein